MEAVTVTIIVGIVTAVVSIVSYFAGEKKTSKGEVAEMARFQGNVEAKLDGIKEDIKDLKKSLNDRTSQLSEEINRQIKEHEERYHS